jgi:hypothetical protein
MQRLLQPSAPDETAPKITNIKADAKASSATIIWTTDGAGNDTVRYSTDTNNFRQGDDPKN